ncbi:hypothetical protein HYV80_02150 [Candidatus Woesearchaeota archaeon]|nr:hypothetical protein [Candidatus Woesearchaeota archaeon]
MEGKRTRVGIIEDMLSSIISKGGRIKPTHLMYKSNMAHGQMKAYLDDLVQKELVKEVKEGNYGYVIITDKGHEFVQKLKQMREFEKAFGL